jgi:hypothetical protein
MMRCFITCSVIRVGTACSTHVREAHGDIWQENLVSNDEKDLGVDVRIILK